MKILTIRRFFLASLLIFLMAPDSRGGEWWQGSMPSGSSITVPQTKPAYPSSPRSGSEHQWHRDDGTSRTEKPREGPGFFQQLYSDYKAKENEEKHQKEVRRVKEEIATISSGISVQMPPSPVKLAPSGTPFFNTSMTHSGYEIAAGPISGIRTPANRIPRENLRRAAAILAPIAGAMSSGKFLSDEDAYFLARESAQAMEGAPLSIEVRDIPNGREDDTRRLAKQAQDMGQARIEAERATAERMRAGERLAKVQEAITRRQGNADALLREREELLKSYKSAYQKELGIKEGIRSTIIRYVEASR
jgi:hypothetical protein